MQFSPMRLPIALTGALVLLVLLAPAAAEAQPAPLTDEQKQQYKEHIKRAKAYAALDEFDKAAPEFLAAYKVDNKPALLFNAAHAFWLAEMPDEALEQYRAYLKVEPNGRGSAQARQRFFEVAEARWQKNKLKSALQLYESYIALASSGSFAEVATAKQRFFDAAEIRREQGKDKDAEFLYKRFLKHQSEGPSAKKARDELAEMEAARTAARDDDKDDTKDGQTDNRDDLIAVPSQRSDRNPGGTSRFLFFGTAAIAAGAATFATINAMQISSHERDKLDAAQAYQDATSFNLDENDACADARGRAAAGEINSNLSNVVSACDGGERSALFANLGFGVAAVGAAAAGYFYYKGFIASRGESATATVVPTVSADRVGARLILRF